MVLVCFAPSEPLVGETESQFPLFDTTAACQESVPSPSFESVAVCEAGLAVPATALKVNVAVSTLSAGLVVLPIVRLTGSVCVPAEVVKTSELL